MWATQSGFSSLAITFKSGIFHVEWSYQAMVILMTQDVLKDALKTKEQLPNSKLSKV